MSDEVTLLSDLDRSLILACVFDAECSPGFDTVKWCLIWPDERVDDLSPAGYEVLCDLWIVRGFIHRGVPESEWGVDPASGHFQRVWRLAEQEVPSWIGFRRLQLSQPDTDFLNECVGNPES